MAVFSRQYFVAVALLVALALIWPVVSLAEGNARMYRINKKEQQFRVSLGKGAREPGCHNVRMGRKIHRFVQTGFAWCSVYSKKSCPQDGIVPATWQGGKYRRVEFDESKPQAKMYPGSEWVLDKEADGIRSWYCEPAE